jgi:hypothetical protein
MFPDLLPYHYFHICSSRFSCCQHKRNINVAYNCTILYHMEWSIMCVIWGFHTCSYYICLYVYPIKYLSYFKWTSSCSPSIPIAIRLCVKCMCCICCHKCIINVIICATYLPSMCCDLYTIHDYVIQYFLRQKVHFFGNEYFLSFLVFDGF